MKSNLKKNINIGLILIVCAFCFMQCTPDDKSNETIIARVGNKTISLNEFLRRAEYTVRPTYCSGNTYVHQRIVLNSLIGEKLLSLEAGDTNSFINRENVKLYLEGRKEQAMRQMLYNKEVASKVDVDTNRIKQAYKYAGRKYDISYVNIQDTNAVKIIKEYLDRDTTTFESTMKKLVSLQEVPEREVEWKESENTTILNSLFTSDHKKGDVIGPVSAGNGEFIFMKINGWSNHPAITAQTQEDRFNLVKETYSNADGKVLFQKYVQKVMDGKHLEFNKNVYFALADIMGPLYMTSRKDKDKIFEEGVWKTKGEVKSKNSEQKLDELRGEKLYSIDGKDYTVNDFLKEIKKHPLVFRTKEFPQKDFGIQFQLAILDMVRDKYLTQEAYSMNLDKTNEVQRDQQMWYDNLNAMNVRYKIIQDNNADSLYQSNYTKVVNEILTPVIDSLQQKYSDQIYINVDAFKQIKLTRIDMAVNYANYPFPQVVPGFPIITSGHKLEYGQRMK